MSRSNNQASAGEPANADSLRDSIDLMARLRGPDGCPWDREQTFDSIKRHTLEETYEVFDAIERRAWPELKEELGDLLLQVLFYSQMAAEAGHFDIEGVAGSLNAKLIRRHPHIFGEARAETAYEVREHWERIKREEKGAHGDPQGSAPPPLLHRVPRHVPAMMEAEKLGRAAAKVNFDWADADGVFSKLAEEIGELQAEVRAPTPDAERISEEFGDLLFSAVHLARHLGLDPEFALRAANAKFRRRFHAMEHAAGGEEALRGSSPEQLEELWREAKGAAPARSTP